jgi:hypothetical protein
MVALGFRRFLFFFFLVVFVVVGAAIAKDLAGTNVAIRRELHHLSTIKDAQFASLLAKTFQHVVVQFVRD